ncbi:hypothetical protein [Streptomyces griseocarneus]|uniref:hypothetical protein n=1 Tax=Streptomyces griseocarneus TaxID=51201 RepID=UPI00167D3CFA|nr:hypothetical protein [Streptomyces griseocarneus]MBZ6475867.1 hypothetical protein [Streptomyces griseocarneus]GHG50304.1 hypothetical protein GCM10018779_10310 [Streptomyces griseocarneus]
MARLVNTGRKPLAESLGLLLPGELACECEMWALVTKLSRLPYHERAAGLDPFRAKPPASSPMPAGNTGASQNAT